jgi:hypothetical protein
MKLGHFEEMRDLYGTPFTGRSTLADSFTDVYAETTPAGSEPRTPSGSENP